MVRDSGSVDFSMRRLAEDSEVSLVTPYNFFGSKSGILYALLTESVERLGQGDPSKEDILSLAGIAATEYSRDARFFRPLLRYTLGVPDSEHRPRLVAHGLRRWKRNVEAAVRDGLLIRSVNEEILARQLLITSIGTVELWLFDELDDAGFFEQSLYGSTLLVLAFASDAARPRLTEQLRAIERRLPRTPTTSKPPGGIQSSAA